MAEDKKQSPVPEAHTTPEAPAPETPGGPAVEEQATIPGMEGGPAPSGKVIDLSDVRAAGADKAKAAEPDKVEPPAPKADKQPDKPAPAADARAGKEMLKQARPPKADKAPPTDKGAKKAEQADKPRRGRPPKDQAAPEKKGKVAPAKAPAEAAKADPPAPEVPPAPRDATRAVKEEIVYINLSELHPFKEHPFGVRDDAEMQGLVESVRSGGVNQPALVRPLEDGSYEIIAGHRRQRASELAGFMNMPCIVRNMTDDEAILAMTDDNLRHRETILPSEKALALKKQYEAIKHQGSRGDDAAAGKLSLESVGQRNGMSVKTVQRYIWLNDLVPELKQTMDAGKLSFTPAVEISRIRPTHQKYIAVSIEGQQSSPSKGQANRLRELDKDNKLTPDVIDGILSEEKKKEDRDVIITGSELEKFFGKEATPRQMKDQIMTLLADWKEKQPPELAKPDKKKTDKEK